MKINISNTDGDADGVEGDVDVVGSVAYVDSIS